MAAVPGVRRSELGEALRACRSAFLGVGAMSCMINLLYLTGSIFSSLGPSAFFDLPWLPFYLAICFAFHVLIGTTALVGAIILVALTIVTEFLTRRPAREAMTFAARRNDLAAASRRNAEVLAAMGMSRRLTARWSVANQEYLTGSQRTSDVAGGLGALA